MKKGNILIIYLILGLSFNPCKSQTDKISDEEIYDFLNNVMAELSTDYKICDALSDKTLMTIDGTITTLPGEKFDSTETIKQFARIGYIDSIDISYFLEQQLDSTFRFKQNKINKKLLNQEVIDSIFSLENEVGYDVLRDSFDIKCHGYISKPFFSRDRNTVLISLEWLKGYLYGQGLIIIFKKENGLWKEVQVFGTGES